MILAEWTSHPAQNRPRDVILVAAVVFLFTGAVLSTLDSAFLALLGALILLLAVSPFLVSTHYCLTTDGVCETRLGWARSRRWAELRRVEVGAKIALLSPFLKPSVLDRYRGIVLLLEGAEREQVLSIVHEYIGHGSQS